jgi:hypothetical protein
MSYLSNISNLFNILKSSEYDIKQYDSIGFLLNEIFNDAYFAEEAADELLQKISEQIGTYTKKDLLKMAKNIIFYGELYKYTTGIKFGFIAYYVTSIFAAICDQLHLSNTEPDLLLQEAKENAFALMRKINEIKIIEALKIICDEHLQKLAKFKTNFTDVNMRINMLSNMKKTLLPASYKNSNKVTACPFAVLHSRIDNFREQFKQYQKQVVDTKDNKIRQIDDSFIAKIKQVLSNLYARIAKFFTKDHDKNFADKVQHSMALAA